MFVDGSLTSSGIAIGQCEFNTHLPNIMYIERVTTNSKHPLEKRLSHIFNRVDTLIKEFQVEYMIMEEKFLGKSTSVKNALSMGKADGVIQLAAGLNNIRVGTFENGQIKFTITGFKHAEKEEVMLKVVDIFKNQPVVLKHIIPEYIGKKRAPKQDDMADAVAGLYTYNIIPTSIKEA